MFANKAQIEYPRASQVALSDLYVDDLLSGGDDYESLILLRNQMMTLRESGGFHLTKWSTSISQLANELGQSSDYVNVF